MYLRRKIKPVSSHTLAGMAQAVIAQELAAAAQAGEELTKAMQQVKSDVSRRAGEMERESPLFFGTGDNPSLF